MKARQNADGFAIGFDDDRCDELARAILGEKFEKRGVAKIFFQISPVVEIFGVDFGNGQAIAVKMFGELQEGDIFFANTIENADRADAVVREADDLPARAAQLSLQRLNACRPGMEMLLEQPF